MKKHSTILLGLGLLVGAAPLASARVWDVTADFSDTVNPAGAWSYGWEPSLRSPFSLYTVLERDLDRVDWLTPNGTEPVLWKNLSNQTLYGIPPGWVCLHPGPSEEPSVARWTSPVAGVVSLEGLFGAGDQATLDAYIQKNGVTIWSALDFTTDQPFSFDVTVGVGDTLD